MTTGKSGSVNRRRMLYGGAAVVAGAGIAGYASGEWSAPAAASGNADHPGVADVVADFGAKGDGRTDDSAAFAAAYAYAESRVSGGVGHTVIDVPPGVYLVKKPGALLAGDKPDKRASGLRFRGGGMRISEIVFAPESPKDAYLCRNNNMWSNISFEGLRFTSGTPGASFFSSYSTGWAQNYRFSECEWMGEWEYGLALDGSNNNSEMRWEACRVGGAYRKAFLYSGLSKRSEKREQQDQFLNYWFTDMTVTYDWGNFLEFPYGGSITCRSGSYIITGRRPTPHPEYGFESAFFRFPRASHFDSVQRFHAEDIRFEIRDPQVVVIDCEWSSGTVHFNDCDDTSQSYKQYSDGLTAHRYSIGPAGPLVRYDMCQLSGAHQFRPAAGAQLPTSVRYDMCRIVDHPADAFVAAGSHDKKFARFVDCIMPG
ncbi:glycosyl hydrolase family 28-related protein [Streptomyces sp. H39-S7]|uniref:glycosyl hydrolase family 28-related protein n=1 Tax=Streptomyces sp. H39-S7 TaxID=3004357 RepID=UPI0022B02B3F|nr:glycosyl hydrolase family 28-related protein [Streptomyces sp. H39-S7]MCZ4121162.1 glycosyl hydrolase family 28-related protein [Streptomyces sp. H39-S7]